jgi:hypothetical protein
MRECAFLVACPSWIAAGTSGYVLALMTSRPPPGEDGVVPAAAGSLGVSFGFEDATLCAVASGKVSRLWPGRAGNL